MSFLSILKKIAGPIAGIAAAPVTGGASLIPSIIGAGGAALSGASQASASNRGTKLQALLDVARQNQQAQYENNAQALAQSQDSRAAYKDAARQAIISSYLAGNGGGPIFNNPDRVPATAPGVRAAMQQAAGTYTGAIPGLATRATTAPAYTPISMIDPNTLPLNAGFWEKLMGIAGPALGAYGALASLSGGNGIYGAGPQQYYDPNDTNGVG